eukprot:261765-Pleurochrysis_carterae.AAC.1
MDTGSSRNPTTAASNVHQSRYFDHRTRAKDVLLFWYGYTCMRLDRGCTCSSSGGGDAMLKGASKLARSARRYR